MDVIIAIPAYNEATTVAGVVAAARGHAPVLVVDDGSTDDTALRAAAAGAEVVRHDARRGKGAALATAFSAARAKGATLVVTLDADGQHDPEDVPSLLAAARATPRAVIIGSRRDDALPRGRALAIRLAGFWVNWIAGAAVSDTQSGFRVYPLALFDEVRLGGGRFVFETAVLVEALRRGWCVHEAPIHVVPYAGRPSRFHPLGDGASITLYLVARSVAQWGTELGAGGREVVSLFSRERRTARHARMLARASVHAGTPSWGAAIAVAAAGEIQSRASGWWRHPRMRRARRAALATLAVPAMLLVGALAAAMGGSVPARLERVMRRIYDQEALPALTPTVSPARGGRFDMGDGRAMMPVSSYDVVVVGGGPGGSSAAAFLAAGGLRVALFERDVFPRFHVGESLMPATMLLLDQLGVRETVEKAGFQTKFGAMFFDETNDLDTTFYFLPGMPWPQYTFQVPRAEFDTILLEHARKKGVDVFQPATVEGADFDGDGVTVSVVDDGVRTKVRATMLVDASGRASFVSTRLGERRRIPNLGKVAMFAHFRGAERLSGVEEGNIRIYIREDGWYWWIPLANDITSVGAVVHARTARAWTGSQESLFEDMLRRSKHMPRMLAGAVRVMPVRTEANFAYENAPVVGDRFVAVGDAITFVDPIFSGGVYIALRTGQLASEAILAAFRDGRFSAARFAAYERQCRRGVAPLFKFIHKYYEPAFLDMFMHPQDRLGIYEAVLNVLSGGNWVQSPWRTRLTLRFVFAMGFLKTWLWRLSGRSVESRLEW